MPDNRSKLREKIKEALTSVLPITAIVLLLCFTVSPIPSSLLLAAFILGALPALESWKTRTCQSISIFRSDRQYIAKPPPYANSGVAQLETATDKMDFPASRIHSAVTANIVMNKNKIQRVSL